MAQRVKIAVTGAAGQIGYALVFRIASGEIFGPDCLVDLNLIELEAALPALEGVAMELHDCAFPTLGRVHCTRQLQEGFDGVQWALLVGAAPRKAGMERSDLLQVNGGIFAVQGQALNQYAASDVRVLVVGNPANTNCLIAMHHAPDVPRERFYAMMLLDELRARAQLATRAGVPVAAIRQLAVWGNHSPTQYPDFYHAFIQEQPVTTVIHDEAWLQQDFLGAVQQRGAAVIRARGASSAASAANAALQTIQHLRHDTPVGECYSVAQCSQGEYGVPAGLIFSFPTQTRQAKAQILSGWEHCRFAQEKLQLTLQELVAERDTVRALGMI